MLPSSPAALAPERFTNDAVVNLSPEEAAIMSLKTEFNARISAIEEVVRKSKGSSQRANAKLRTATAEAYSGFDKRIAFLEATCERLERMYHSERETLRAKILEPGSEGRQCIQKGEDVIVEKVKGPGAQKMPVVHGNFKAPIFSPYPLPRPSAPPPMPIFPWMKYQPSESPQQPTSSSQSSPVFRMPPGINIPVTSTGINFPANPMLPLNNPPIDLVGELLKMVRSQKLDLSQNHQKQNN